MMGGHSFDRRSGRRPNTSTSTNRSTSYGFLSMMKDVLLVAVFLALLLMNYLNINIMHVMDQRQQMDYYADNQLALPVKQRVNANKNANTKKATMTTKRLKPKEQEKSFREMLLEKKIVMDRMKKNNTTESRSTLRPKKKTVSRQNKIPGSDQSHIVGKAGDIKDVNNNDTKNRSGTMHSNVSDVGVDTEINNNHNHNHNNDTLSLVQEFDSIYKGLNGFSKFDAAPIVDEEHKLIFFTIPKVACTTFKFLFRRIAGVKDWDFQDGADAKNLPHNPRFNNLRYLYHYSLEDANRMMTDPSWTRAIFVRDPKTRFLSAFLDKAVGNYGSFVANFCCPEAKKCTEENFDRRTSVLKAIQKCQVPSWDSRRKEMTATWLDDQTCCKELHECQKRTMNVEGFLETIRTCRNGHWDPQSRRMEDKYWKYINFIGTMETINDDTERLLKHVGAWEKYGKSGWGPKKDLSITQSAGGSQSHTTGASSKIYQWFTPEKERLVEDFYKEDYANAVFNFSATNLTKPIVDGVLLKHNDTIYQNKDWDGAPIVIPKHKLVFFTLPRVGGTKWKQAFRRMEGHSDWNVIGGTKGLPHDPNHNGLKYLYDFPIEEAETIMTSSNWTRAIFVRSPKDRFLSVFWHMRNNPSEIVSRCCPHDPGCSTNLDSLLDFVKFVQTTCFSAHWAPYAERFDAKWWKHMDFVGRLEESHLDAERLLRKIGAWESIGRTGWGENGDEAIFVKAENAFESAHQAVGEYTWEADEELNEYYKADYENPYLNFTSKKLYILGGNS